MIDPALQSAILFLHSASAVVLREDALGLRTDNGMLLLRNRAVDFLETLNRVHTNLLLPPQGRSHEQPRDPAASS